jgi:pyrroloquinoline quinone biosynthesis protein D
MSTVTNPTAAPASAADVPPLDVVPRIGTGFRLQWEDAQQCFVLLYPEGMVRLNQSAGEILRRCDGARDAQAIVADLEVAFSASGLAPDVQAFLAIARRQRWVAWD